MIEIFSTVPAGYRLVGEVAEPVPGRKHFRFWASRKLYLLKSDTWPLGVPAHQHLTASKIDPELVPR